MSDSVALEPSELPSTPRVGDKVVPEEQGDIPATLENKILEGSENIDENHPVNQEENNAEPQLVNDRAEEEDHEPQGEIEGAGGENSKPQHENEGAKEDRDSQNKNEGAEAKAEEPGTINQETSENENASGTDEESGNESDTESDSDYTSEESESSQSHTDHSASDKEESEQEEDDNEADVIVEEEDAKDEGVKKKEDNKQDNEWEEEESKVNARERGDGQEAVESTEWNPAVIPRRTTFWGHDDRWSDTPEEERRKPTSRKLWDKTSDRWEHDMYREEEQGPKTKEELEVRPQEID